jgi:hypothetical protein
MNTARGSAASRSTVSNLDKLALSLRHALEVWKIRSAGSKELEERRITVVVTYTGDVAELEGAGLAIGRDEHGEVSGQIAWKDVERLAAVPGVKHVECSRSRGRSSTRR